MSSTNVASEQTGSTEPPLTIQDRIKRISELHKSLAREVKAEADSPQQTTVGTNTEQYGSNSGDVSQGNSDDTNKQDGDVSQENSNKQDGDVNQENQEGVSKEIKNTENNKKGKDVEQEKTDESKKMKEVLDELDKLCEQLQHMISLFKILEKFETNLREPLKTLEANVKDILKEIKNTENNKKGKDVGQKKTDESNKSKGVLDELDKLCEQIQHIFSLFKKLENFETNLREPLKTLEANVKDILKDLPLVKVDELPKQVLLNLHVLRNNITRVRIQIPLQRQTANTNSEANRALQTTVATREAEDLPHLYNEGIFERSYYFKEIEEKYKDLDKRQKRCLLCFAIFPENSEIKKRLLRFWWVGENLIRVEDPKDEMKHVTETIDKFVEKGFIEPVQKKNKLQPRSYKMNPIVRSCLIKFAKQAGFFDYDPEGKPTMDFSSCKKACMVKSEGAPVSWFSDYLKEPGPERLSADLLKLQKFFNFPDRMTLYEASQRFHELKTLFNISRKFPALPMEWFSKMTDIKVLYLGEWETSAARQRTIEVDDINSLEGLKNMKKLRLLSLQGIYGITKLPSTLCKLENLRILDLRACHNLKKLPDRIGALKKLTYLDLSLRNELDGMPKQLNQLWELQVLKGFVVGDGKNSCTLEDLSELKNLRKLSVNVNTTNFNIDDAEEALSKFQKLEKLKIAWRSGRWTGNNSTQDSSENIGASKSMALKVSKQDNRQGLLHVKKLKRKNPEGLEKLVKLDLKRFPRSTPPDWLVPQKMVRLTNLSIRDGRLRHIIQEGEQKWKEVKTLRLKFLMDFKMNWKEMQERFPKLNYLENVRCPRITFCPCDASGVWQDSSK